MRFFIVIILALALVGCTSNQVIQSLENILAASEAAFPIVAAAANLPPATPAAISAYLQAASTATANAATELGSGDPSAVKAAKIAAMFATVVRPVLPAGTPQEVAAVVTVVANAVANFLANFDPTAKLPKLTFNPSMLQKIRTRALGDSNRALVLKP